ncbi:MAG: gliding motility-associated C-terminal domain-containing protein [Sphingobacterium sp.]|jgi:gliding motility-associated-like protein|nr:gliding motility-associated C-terminal domain-containing protein [Sphingobacterium sp.]
MKWLSFFVLTMGISLNSFCQTADKKAFIFDEIREIGESEALVIDSDTLIFGPNAELSVMGILEVKSSYIIFAPSARLEGTGKMLIMPPSNSNMQTPTWIDGNANSMLSLRIELFNTGNLILSNLQHSFLKGIESTSANFYTRRDIGLMEDGACIELRGNRLRLDIEAVLENSSPTRMVISGNSSSSIYSKKISGNTTYTFAIGLKEGDYSPVTLTPKVEAELFVSLMTSSVNDKSLSFTKKDGGVNRIWGVYADHNVRTTYVFEHSKKDESGAVQSQDMEIFQYSDAKEWQLVTTDYLGKEQHSTKNLASMYGGVAKNYFSKFGKVRNGPQSADDYMTVKSGQFALIPILANDKGGDGKLLVEKTQIVEQPKNGTVTLSSIGEAEYQPTAGFIGSDLFVYEVVDEFGLVSRSTVYITVEGDGIFTLSNVVTPNGDGYNDKLVFISEEQFMSLELTIVNRWGDRLYHNSSYDNSWDGAGLSGGTYYYVMKAKRHKGDVVNQRGWILLTK